MHQDVLNIFDYLPIRSDDESREYIEHLWQAFLSLESATSSAQPFSMMPFHLLFMMAVQCKVLRVFNEMPERYSLAFTLRREVNENLLEPEVPGTIALLGEADIVHLLRMADLPKSDAKGIVTSTVKYRNETIAHARAQIERNPGNKIKDYLRRLKIVQKSSQYMNRSLANNWLNEIQKDDDIDNFLETRFQSSFLCPFDLIDVVSTFLASQKLDNAQSAEAAQKLKACTVDKSNDYRRFSYIQP